MVRFPFSSTNKNVEVEVDFNEESYIDREETDLVVTFVKPTTSSLIDNTFRFEYNITNVGEISEDFKYEQINYIEQRIKENINQFQDLIKVEDIYGYDLETIHRIYPLVHSIVEWCVLNEDDIFFEKYEEERKKEQEKEQDYDEEEYDAYEMENGSLKLPFSFGLKHIIHLDKSLDIMYEDVVNGLCLLYDFEPGEDSYDEIFSIYLDTIGTRRGKEYRGLVKKFNWKELADVNYYDRQNFGTSIKDFDIFMFS